VARAWAGLHRAPKRPENAVPRGLTPVRWDFIQKAGFTGGQFSPGGILSNLGAVREADREACTVPFVR
jgi:hypothetical protein